MICGGTSKLTGLRCKRPVMKNSKFCLGHDPEKRSAETRKNVMATATKARGQLPGGLIKRKLIAEKLKTSYSSLYDWERRGLIPTLSDQNQKQYMVQAKIVAKKAKNKELPPRPPELTRMVKKATIGKGKKNQPVGNGEEYVEFAMVFRRMIGGAIRDELRSMLFGEGR